MIRKIVLENFMAHKRTEIELGPGVTALTGANNIGKSAVVEALRCIAGNRPSKHVIRHGAKEARVTLELDDGVLVTWIRKKTTAGYEILRPGAEEPEEHWKLGQSVVPEDVAKVLRLAEVKLKDRNAAIDVHIGNQREPIFLLNENGGVVADFLASSTEAGHLLSMQKLLGSKTAAAKSKAKEHRTRMQAVERQLDTLQPLPEIALLLERVAELEKSIEENIASGKRLRELLDDYERSAADLEHHRKSLAVLAELRETPDALPVRELGMTLASMERTAAEHGGEERRLSVLQGLNPAPEMQAVGALASVRAELLSVVEDLRREQMVASALQNLSVPPELEPVADGLKLQREIRDKIFEMRRLQGCLDLLSKLGDVPEIVATAPVGDIVDELRKLEAEALKLRSELAETEAREREFMERLNTRLREIGRCPVCRSAVDAEAFLGEQHHD